MTTRGRSPRRYGSPTVHNVSLIVIRRVSGHGHGPFVRMPFWDSASELGHVRAGMVILLTTRGSRRGVVEVARRDRRGGWIGRPTQFCQRSRSRRIGVQSRRGHWSAQVSGVWVLRGRPRSRIQALGSRVRRGSIATRRWWVRSRWRMGGHRRGPRVIRLISSSGRRRWISVCWGGGCRWSVSIWHLAGWRRRCPVEMGRGHLRRHGVGTTLVELGSL